MNESSIKLSVARPFSGNFTKKLHTNNNMADWKRHNIAWTTNLEDIYEINFKLEQALKDILYIPSKSKNFLTKEYLIDMNFKTELMKTECFL